MAAVIRVKRRVDEEPLNAFVLNSKRRKCDENDDAIEKEISTVVKFAGTVHNQTDSVSQVTKVTKEEAKEVMAKVRKPSEHRAKNREEQRTNSQNNRFRVVNCSRTLDTAESSGNEATNPITIVDIEKQNVFPETNAEEHLPASSAASSPPNSADPGTDFVYDLYVPEVGQPEVEFHDNFVENMLSVEPFDDLIFGSYRDNGLIKYDPDDDCDSEDSNDENNYRNEYPDTDEDSVGDEDMRRAVEGMCLDRGDEEDSDYSDQENEYYLDCYGPSKDEEYVHSIDPNDPTFEKDVDFQDTADRYGQAYAKYRSRILKAFEKAKCEDIDEEDSDDDRSSNEYGSDNRDDEECFSENELDKYA